ncbi:hypothetical protein BDY19DRAFT_1025355 [Irpex rosettiformis]|uniref:Uncharacterized protein n=1 Tax=Irpex rosettiformis TaxID=378272 RepID=A0ACB8TRV9_9APHY|nr:hypothetical protein BDY19DRAFT_1025355 [Irpex rosettiformis]
MSPPGLSHSPLTLATNRLTSIASHIRTDAEKLKVIVLRDMGPDVMPLLYDRPELNVVMWPHDKACKRQWILENVPGASGILATIVDKIKAGPSLRVISTMSVGYEHIDVQTAAQRDIKVGYTPDVLTEAVADISVMLALMASRNGRQGIEFVGRGEWPHWAPYTLCGPQLSTNPITQTRTAGFIGFGRISQATLSRLIPFGFTNCIFTSSPTSKSNPQVEEELRKKFNLRSLRRGTLDDVARGSDVVFVLAPGGPQTYYIVNEDFLRKMKKTAVLVNTARGTLVDSDALAKALREGWIWGAGVDVVEGEPDVGIDHPLVKEPRCVIVPHIGSATNETRLTMASLAAKNLIAGLFNEPMPVPLQLNK